MRISNILVYSCQEMLSVQNCLKKGPSQLEEQTSKYYRLGFVEERLTSNLYLHHVHIRTIVPLLLLLSHLKSLHLLRSQVLRHLLLRLLLTRLRLLLLHPHLRLHHHVLLLLLHLIGCCSSNLLLLLKEMP